MKKFLVSLSVVMMAIIISLTAVGCSFIDTTSNVGNQTIITNPSAEISGQSISLNKLDETSRVKYEIEDAVALVERTSVAIITDSGAGSGVIIDVSDAGNYIYIITCHHMVSNGGNITVYIPDENCSYENNDYIFEGYIGSEIYKDKAVTLVGGDRVSDIAVIKIDMSKPAVSGNILALSKIEKAVVPADDYKVRKGERVFAIGNPSGSLPGSVCEGVVSYLDRVAPVDSVGNMHLMQISVTTNQGNSGGGLYNMYGELIGITNAGNTTYEAINFAIPCVNDYNTGYLTIVKQLIGSATDTNYGYVDGRWELGISVAQRSSYSYYIEIASVVSGSNASLAGLKEGDVLNSITIEDQTYSFSSSSYFNYYMGLARTNLGVGDSFTLNISRKASNSYRYETMNIKVTITVANYIFCNTGN